MSRTFGETNLREGVAAGASAAALPATVIDGGITHSVLSMDAFVFGAA